MIRFAYGLVLKAFVIGSFPLTIETPADLATRLANISVFDLGVPSLIKSDP